MLKLKTCGLNCALNVINKSFIKERFKEYICDFDGRADFAFSSSFVPQISVPEGTLFNSSGRVEDYITPEGDVVRLSKTDSGEYVISMRISADASVSSFNILQNYTMRYYTAAQAEYMHSCSFFADKIALLGGMTVHGAAISCNDTGIIFSARPGIGKSTQANMWQKLWPDAVKRINDDRPVLMFENDRVMMHGIPWSGSVNLKLNTSVPLGCIFMIKRGEKPACRLLQPKDIFRPIYQELCVSHLNRTAVSNIYDSLNMLLGKVPVYELECTMEDDTPLLAKNILEKDGIL